MTISTRIHAVTPSDFIEALRRLQSAQEDAAKANALCQSRDYDLCHMAVVNERVEAFRIANQLGINLRIVAGAMG